MMQGQCKDCGCMCLLDELWERYGCPACRAARVAEAFRPIDTLRTALGIGKLTTGVNWDSADWQGVKARADAVLAVHRLGQSEDAPRGCKMPLDDAAQIYELRRMFRL